MNGNIVVRVSEKVTEGEGLTTLRFDLDRTTRPGQFLMVWVPGVDEIPMSLSYTGRTKGITIREVGEATKALSEVKVGERIGVRGPFGRGFTMPTGKYLVVGGGTGIACVLPAIEMVADPTVVDVAIGARSAKEIIFEGRAKQASEKVAISTDDGSYGEKGTVVQLVDSMLSKRTYSQVLGCGPEKMLYYLLQTCKKYGVESQLSLERFMKCGSGLCGSCALDGKRVCADGPVFFGREVDQMLEFNRIKRDESGRPVQL